MDELETYARQLGARIELQMDPPRRPGEPGWCWITLEARRPTKVWGEGRDLRAAVAAVRRRFQREHGAARRVA
jgi:hypothetical protein